MNTKQWVQHISGQGEKWEILSDNCHESEWRVKARTHEYYHDLPKSEFILCDPPEQWEDVTDTCSWSNDSYDEFYLKASNGDRIEAFHNNLYRVRKVQLWDCPFGINGMNRREQWAFIIERRQA